MAEEKLLTVRDVALFLDISEKEVLNLVESGILPAYKVGGVYVRFKKEQVQEYKKKVAQSARPHAALKVSFKDRFEDFFYFNDFYLLAILLIIFLLLVIFRGY